jgi:predicted nucleic acid-binding protein
LEAHHFEPVIFDCVLAEVVSIVARRMHEKRRMTQLADLLDQLQTQFPSRSIVWLNPDLPKLYDKVVEMVKQSDGELNFNDALIALSCQLRGLELIASFDSDFDHHAPWLKRVTRPDQL